MDPGRRSILAALLAAPFAKPSMAQPALISRNIPSTGEGLPVIGAGTWQTFDVGADPAARRAAAALRVPARGLRLRMKALGMT